MIFTFSVILVIVLIFRQWFTPGYIAGGDLWPMARHAIESLFIYPFAWNSALGGGLGLSTIPYLWNHFQYALPLVILGKNLHLSWDVIVRFGYLFPFLCICLISSYRFGKYFIGKPWAWLTSLIYTTNTYSVLVIAGGQTGVAMAYAFSPFVLLRFIQSIEHQIAYGRPITYENVNQKSHNKPRSTNKREFIVNGLLLSLLVVFDLRISYLIIGVGLLYVLLQYHSSRLNLREIFYLVVYTFLVPLLIATAFHLYWILPAFIYRGAVTDLGSAYTGAGMLTFLSFADFSHALSLLHPNWPENIFGKVYFLQPEFLILPLLAFSSLLYSRKNTSVYLFVFLGLIGAFLAKGVNEPFGGVYLWLFEHIPGFVMFRDPTKFYLLIALSYAVLIPFALEQIGLWMGNLLKRRGKYVPISAIYAILLVLFVLYWGFAHREAVLGKLGGTFQARSVPVEYLTLKDYLAAKPEFSRVLWVPGRQRYGFYSDDRPGLSIEAFGIASPSSFIAWIGKPEAGEQLKRYAVSDIIVPTDPLGELFVTDRRYDNEKRVSVVAALRADPDVREISEFGDIAVFQTPNTYGHVFFVDAPDESLSVRRIAPTEYEVSLPAISAERTLVFSESYDPYWELEVGTQKLSPQKTQDRLQEYHVEAFGGGRAKLRYRPQQFVYYGLVVSGITFVLLVGYLSYTIIATRKKSVRLT